MQLEEYEALSLPLDTVIRVSVDDLADDSDRTLIYGYTTHRNTFHAYLKNRQLGVTLYDHQGLVLFHISGTTLPAEDMIPNKRVYPQWSDYEFCDLLKRLGVYVSYTNYQEPTNPQLEYKDQYDPFYGITKG